MKFIHDGASAHSNCDANVSLQGWRCEMFRGANAFYWVCHDANAFYWVCHDANASCKGIMMQMLLVGVS